MSPAKFFRHLRWFLTFLFVLASGSFALASNPDVIKTSHHDVSPPFSQMAILIPTRSQRRSPGRLPA
jgi:hypothetical protein